MGKWYRCAIQLHVEEYNVSGERLPADPQVHREAYGAPLVGGTLPSYEDAMADVMEKLLALHNAGIIIEWIERRRAENSAAAGERSRKIDLDGVARVC